MAKITAPQFLPVFGTGAPGASVPITAEYFDTSTTPYTPYIYDPTAAAWKSFTGVGSGTNATQLQGNPISATAPTNGQVLEWNGTAWTPTTPTGGPVPSIVQVGQLSGTNGAVTMGSAPTQHNLLVAFYTTQGIVPASGNPGSGWTLLPGSVLNGAVDDCAILYKVAGASESTSQTPTTDTGAGCITIFELNDAATSIFLENMGLSGTATFTGSLSAQFGEMIIGVASCHSASATVSSLTGATANGAVNTGGSRAQQAFHATSPVQGAQTLGVVWGATESGSLMILEIK